MACVILPSETARLVYGYLVKENLNDIALQFLESSPYLMDCCQIVKSGFQFNTKLMGKNLPELLQEYSVIHNLVNNKISHLCKSSLLYKRIKLRCESLPEILELILFWKYRNSKGEESSSNPDKAEKNSNSNEGNTNCELPTLSEVSQIKISENISDSISYNNKNNNSNSVEKDNADIDSYHSKLNCETYSGEREVEECEVNYSQMQKGEGSFEDEKKNKKSLIYAPVQNEEEIESSEKNKVKDVSDTVSNDNINCNNNSNSSSSNNNNSSNSNNNNNNSSNSNNNNNNSSSNTNNINNNNNNNNHNNDSTDNRSRNITSNCLLESKFNSTTNILSIDVDSHCGDLVNGNMAESSLISHEEPNRFENPIKIIGIQEENQNENNSLEVFSKPVREGDGNMNLENSSVVFVSPDVGNVTINQEQSQIIVIPFDYYKANGLENDIEIDNNKDLGLTSHEVVSQQKNDIIFEETTSVATSSVTSLFNCRSSKSSVVDENIITENDFIKNSNLMYNIEKELYTTEPPLQAQQVTKEPKENVSVQTVSAPVIVVSQPVPARRARYRAILPKKKEPVQMHPVVVVHPLLENNKDLTKTISTENETFSLRRGVNRKVKKKSGVSQKAKTKETEKSENFKEFSGNAAAEDKVSSQMLSEKPELKLPSVKETEIESTNEEKENFEKTETKKNETPVFFTKRNSKRLSLSTPRRKSHIRALEFETPPKTNEEKKKSKTSPKIKVEQAKVERKNVRNTLFKSPISEDPPAVSKELQPNFPEPLKPFEPIESLNELSIPIATRSPNTKLSDAWENLTGVGCVIGQNDASKTSPNKKMWDADLRCFIMENSVESRSPEKKRNRKPEKNQKDNRKSTKKKLAPPKRIKPTPVTVSPSKISLTAKRNTYSINGNEEGSPIRTSIDDLKIVTPFKDIDVIRPTEETPLTKLLRENINTIDIDLSMINTPSFPPTPSIVITPDLEDTCIAGANYYSPTKDCLKDKVLKITDYFKGDTEKTNKKETKEMHEKVIGDLVSKAKEIIGIGKETQEENVLKRRPSGKILSMVKIQMLTQCDKKLMENIPINEESNFSGEFTHQTVIGNVIEETAAKSDLKVELEEKRKRALKKIKVVKENLSQTKGRVNKRSRKRKRSGNMSKSEKSNSDISKESVEDKQCTPVSEESLKKASVLHSTPYTKNNSDKMEKTDSDKKLNDEILEDIRQQFPKFDNNASKYPELSEKSRKKLHYVENFLKLADVAKFINEFDESNPPKIFLKPSLRRFFYVFYKWLKHPHKRELNASGETNALLKEYLSLFDKVNLGLNHKTNRFKKGNSTPNMNGFFSSHDFGDNAGAKAFQSDDDEREYKMRESEKRKDEDTEDGVVSTLPLKKRKSTVQQVENKTARMEKSDAKNHNSDNASQTQNFLQDIDVDRFLSQIHGQENR